MTKTVKATAGELRDWWAFNLNLFAGVGGWEVPDKGLGQKTDGLETNDSAIATAKLAGHFIYKQDVTKYDLFSGHIYTGLKSSPPCGPFTIAGSGAGRKAMADLIRALRQMRDTAPSVPLWVIGRHPEASLVLEPMRVILQGFKSGRPFRWIAMEQTREVLPMWEAYATELRQLGYSVDTGVLRAEQYGVPQTRRRAILVASLDREAKLPEPTHGRYHPQNHAIRDAGKEWYISMGKALGIGWPAPGAFLRSNYGTGGDANNRGLRELWKPAPTITRKYNRNKWVLGSEVLGAMTDREASVLQTFPADYPWQGNKTQVQLQIGNAIPPLLARSILQQVV